VGKPSQKRMLHRFFLPLEHKPGESWRQLNSARGLAGRPARTMLMGAGYPHEND
jgi:hypothetical protein